MDKSTIPSASKTKEDLTGKSRLVKNTIVSWSSELFIIAIGFVIPRLMHEQLGQTILGVWDFSWAFVNYLRVMNLGISSSVNRYVAKYRAEDRVDKLSVFISTVTSVQFLLASLVALSLIPIYFVVEKYYASELGPDLKTAQYAISILGIGVAFELLFDSAKGVISGLHRWDIHTSLYAASALLNLILMATVLFLNGGLIDLALAYLTSTIIVEFYRFFLSIKMAPYIKRNPLLFSKKEAKEIILFGVKTILNSFPIIQAVLIVNLITASYLGPAILAIYARQYALIRHLSTMINRFTMILSPTVSSIQSLNSSQEIANFFLASVRFNFSLALPAVVLFVCFGDLVVLLWMGEEYQNWLLMSTLAIGHLFLYGQDGCASIMQGMNMHGRLTKPIFIVMTSAFILVFAVLCFKEWTLLSSALLLTIPTTLAYGVTTPYLTIKALNVNTYQYLRYVIATPALFNFPFIALLAVCRLCIEKNYLALAGVAFTIAIITEMTIYYIVLIPKDYKKALLTKLKILPR